MSNTFISDVSGLCYKLWTNRIVHLNQRIVYNLWYDHRPLAQSIWNIRSLLLFLQLASTTILSVRSVWSLSYINQEPFIFQATFLLYWYWPRKVQEKIMQKPNKTINKKYKNWIEFARLVFLISFPCNFLKRYEIEEKWEHRRCHFVHHIQKPDQCWW